MPSPSGARFPLPRAYVTSRPPGQSPLLPPSTLLPWLRLAPRYTLLDWSPGCRLARRHPWLHTPACLAVSIIYTHGAQYEKMFGGRSSIGIVVGTCHYSQAPCVAPGGRADATRRPTGCAVQCSTGTGRSLGVPRSRLSLGGGPLGRALPSRLPAVPPPVYVYPTATATIRTADGQREKPTVHDCARSLHCRVVVLCPEGRQRRSMGISMAR